MTPAAALVPYKTKLARQEDGEGLFASSTVNPPASTTVYHWFYGWRRGQYGDEGPSLSWTEQHQITWNISGKQTQNNSQEASTSTPTGQGQPVAEPEQQQLPMDTEPQLDTQGITGSSHQQLQKIYEEWWRQPSPASGNPYYASALQQLLRQMHKIMKEPQKEACP
ncbi:hypothetical protein HPB48_023242 [Haemaphysalis longicornis]|uniref:Uncharacterized protein n=1 Tax=Haemaphysalis longicornis TaxID=44386 RepID=A0A9J6GW29_HAELO|nr:hypothetical protein HPB48_023242 [Haemaphysalis longicornis]